MPKFKNVSPVGDLYFPLVGAVVAAGEVVDLSDDDAVHIAGQDSVWLPVTESKGNSK